MPSAVSDDTALVQGALAGRQQDFETLVERYQKMIHAFALRYVRHADAANEVTQATFIRAYTQLAALRDVASFKTWLFQIALNQCRGIRRAAAVRQTVSLDEVPEGLLGTEEVDPDATASRRRLEGLIARLPGRQRAVLALRVFSDLPFKEIARIEGISENAAKVNYHHAVMRLKQWLTGEPC